MTHSLFPDDSAPAITGLVLTASEAPLSKEQKAFNNLLAKLDKAPETGLGDPMGVFEMRNDVLVFTPAPKPVAPPSVPTTVPPPGG